MTLTFNCDFKNGLVVLAIAFFSLKPTSAEAEEQSERCTVDHAEIRGLSRTDPQWLSDYLGLSFPLQMNIDDAVAVRGRIMTTDVYTAASVSLEHVSQTECSLSIEVVEKWTTIPVIRGAYGGGTPLVVVGGYETHAQGKLYLLGLEARRYGSRPPGLFAFAKSPRAWRGRGSFGSELWLDRRRRAFFDSEGQINAYADSEAWVGKFQWLYPLSLWNSNFSDLQGGIHAELTRESPSTFNDRNLERNEELKPTDLSTPHSYQWTATLMPMIAHDKITVDAISLDGSRTTLKMGGQVAENARSGAAEFETFAYHRYASVVNLAVHGFAGTQGSDSLKNVYFLGGFDSVRGLPDGIHYGTRMMYGNAELRYLALRANYLELQTAAFVDHGTAFSKPEDFRENRETALGVGLRFSVPQIYRLLVRIDYGWSVGHTKSQGLSIGLGQFFQPYKLTF